MSPQVIYRPALGISAGIGMLLLLEPLHRSIVMLVQSFS